MVRRVILGMVVALVMSAGYAEDVFDDVAAVPLFDGKTFDGWEGELKWFRIEDGAMVAGSLDEPIPHNYFLCTKEPYGDFELSLQFKVAGNANGGIQFRSERVPDNTEVSGYQADLGWNYWGCLYDESRRNKVLVNVDEAIQKHLVKPDDWNDYVIRVWGNRIQLVLNGKMTVDYTEEEEGIAQDGIIGLQIHAGPPSEVRYRNLEIKTLAKKDGYK